MTKADKYPKKLAKITFAILHDNIPTANFPVVAKVPITIKNPKIPCMKSNQKPTYIPSVNPARIPRMPIIILIYSHTLYLETDF